MNRTQVLHRLKDVIRRKHFSYATEQAYCGWVDRYSRFVECLDPTVPSEQKLESFVTMLAKQGVAASTQNQAFNAIVFFYREVISQKLGDVNGLRARREATVRVAPSVDETRVLLDEIRDRHGYPTRLISLLLYGCGLRVSEPLNLRIKDVQLADSRLIIRGAKGGKDRVVSLPCSLVAPLKLKLKRARVIWEIDRENRVPVPLPGRLSKKYPGAPFARQWFWVIPALKTCRHPRTGETVRWRCHEANVQRAVKDAARKCGLDGLVTPHVLRHAYATHAMQRGAFVRDVQSAMGHVSLETTMGYLHTEIGRVPSPLDAIA
ncbi:MAG TPA: integron integrase [Chthoniobacterales bacterium]